MKVLLPAEVRDAVNRLKITRDYQLLQHWLAGEFDREVMGLLHGAADSETYVRLGKARVFQFILSVMQGGDDGTTKANTKAGQRSQ